MAITAAQLLVRVGADTKKAEQELAGFRGQMSDLAGGLARSGLRMTAGLTAPIVGMTAMFVNAGQEINRAMGNVQSLGVAEERILALRDAVQDMSISVGIDTTTMAEGLYQVVSAFGDTADTEKILEINAKAAAAGLATVEQAIALTSAVTKGYGDTSVEAMQKVSDLAFTTVQLGQTTFPELAANIGKVTPLAASLGVEMEELFAVFATASGVTGSASEVSTQFRGILQSLMAPTAEMTKLFESLGVASGAALLEQQGLVGAIQTIVTAAQTAGIPLQKYISSIEGQTLALALAGPQAEDFAAKLKAMTTAAGATEAAFQAQTQGINAAGFAMQQAQIKFQVFREKIAEGLGPAMLAAMPAVEQMGDALLGIGDKFASLSPQMQTWIVVALGMAAAIGPALLMLGGLATALTALLSPIGAAIAAAVALGVAFALAFRSMQSLDLSAMLEDANAQLTDFTTGVQTKIDSIDWSAMIATANEDLTTFTTGVQANLDAIDWSSMFAGANEHLATFTTDVQASIDAIDWAGMVSNANENLSAFTTGVQEKLDAVDWSGFWAGLSTANAEADAALGDVDLSIATMIKNVDWSGLWEGLKASSAEADAALGEVDLSIAAMIKNVDWSGLWEGLKEASAEADLRLEGFEAPDWIANLATTISEIQWPGPPDWLALLPSAISQIQWPGPPAWLSGEGEGVGILQWLRDWTWPPASNGLSDLVSWEWPGGGSGGLGELFEWTWPEGSGGLAELLNWSWPLASNGLIDLIGWVWPGKTGGLATLVSWRWPALAQPDWVSKLLSALGAVGGLLGIGRGSSGSSGGSTSGYTGGSGGGRAGGEYASGTPLFGGGLAWVGERGPELVRLPAGSRIYDNRASQAMAGETTINVYANVASDIDIERLTYRIRQELRRTT